MDDQQRTWRFDANYQPPRRHPNHPLPDRHAALASLAELLLRIRDKYGPIVEASRRRDETSDKP